MALSGALTGCAGGRTLRADCEACPAMRRIPAGDASFGSVAGAPYQRPDELPRRTVRIERAFAVSSKEVTRGQYAAFVHATSRPAGGDCLTDRAQTGQWVYDVNTTWLDPGFKQGDDHPVACVSYDDALAYVDWLNSQTRGGYRLLTEPEWEYVAAGDAATLFPWGDEKSRGCAFANGFDETTWTKYRGMDTTGYPLFDPLPCRDGWVNTSPAGSLAPNKFGVYDMIGNVSEWVAGCYRATHAPDAAENCDKHVAKGGSWGTLAHNLRTAERFPYAAAHRDDSIGIRIARDL